MEVFNEITRQWEEAEISTGDIIFCKNCGKQLPDNALFCNKCGAEAQPEGTGVPQSGTSAPHSHHSANSQNQPDIAATRNNTKPKRQVNIIESVKSIEKKTIGKILIFALIAFILSQVYLMNAETKEMQYQYEFIIIDGKKYTHNQFLAGEIPKSVWSTDEFKKEMDAALWGMKALDAEQIGNLRGWDWPQDVWDYWFGEDNTSNIDPNEIIDVGRGIKMPAYAFYYYMGVDMASSSFASKENADSSSPQSSVSSTTVAHKSQLNLSELVKNSIASSDLSNIIKDNDLSFEMTEYFNDRTALTYEVYNVYSVDKNNEQEYLMEISLNRIGLGYAELEISAMTQGIEDKFYINDYLTFDMSIEDVDKIFDKGIDNATCEKDMYYGDFEKTIRGMTFEVYDYDHDLFRKNTYYVEYSYDDYWGMGIRIGKGYYQPMLETENYIAERNASWEAKMEEYSDIISSEDSNLYTKQYQFLNLQVGQAENAEVSNLYPAPFSFIRDYPFVPHVRIVNPERLSYNSIFVIADEGVKESKIYYPNQAHTPINWEKSTKYVEVTVVG